MGYFLLYESMLDSVLWARDRYLAPAGLVLPSHCSMYLVGMHDVQTHRDRFAFWDDVYGFRMSCMKSAVLADAEVSCVSPDLMLTDPVCIKVR